MVQLKALVKPKARRARLKSNTGKSKAPVQRSWRDLEEYRKKNKTIASVDELKGIQRKIVEYLCLKARECGSLISPAVTLPEGHLQKVLGITKNGFGKKISRLKEKKVILKTKGDRSKRIVTYWLSGSVYLSLFDKQ